MRWLAFGFQISLFLTIILVQYLYSRRAHKTREHVFHCCCGTCASSFTTVRRCSAQRHRTGNRVT